MWLLPDNTTSKTQPLIWLSSLPILLPTEYSNSTISSQNLFSFSIALSTSLTSGSARQELLLYPGKNSRNLSSTYRLFEVTLGFSSNFSLSSLNTSSKCNNNQNSKHGLVTQKKSSFPCTYPVHIYIDYFQALTESFPCLCQQSDIFDQIPLHMSIPLTG